MKTACRLAGTALLPVLFCLAAAPAQDAAPEPPKSGPVEILPLSSIRPGLKGTAWTVFRGTKPEPIPVEIIGRWRNAWGPGQDVILGKLGGEAAKTNVAGGMSGSPVYVGGKLVGAIALRLSVFSPDAICGITPIETMLEIREMDASKPSDAREPVSARPLAGPPAPPDSVAAPNELLLALAPHLSGTGASFVPIGVPLGFAGFHSSTLEQFRGLFDDMGVAPALGGAAGSSTSVKPAAGWDKSLQPGEVVAGVLVNGDLSVTGLGTVTYNDGHRILAFGHNFLNLGPVSMPMSGGEVIHVLSSAFQPNKVANATDIVGALRQDRHSGILGALGETAEMIPQRLTVRSWASGKPVDKHLRFNVFVHPKWTPTLLLLTAYDSLQDVNGATSDEATYTLKGRVEFDGLPPLELTNTVTTMDAPMPTPLQIAAWWGEQFNRLFTLPSGPPKIRSVECTIEMHPERRLVTIENALLEQSEVEPGGEIRGRVVLRAWSGKAESREFRLKVPLSMTRGEHRVQICDSDVLNRAPAAVALLNRHLSAAEAVNLLREERPNSLVNVALMESRPTVYEEDRTLEALPGSVLNAISQARASRQVVATPDTPRASQSFALDAVVTGNISLRVNVK